NNTRVKFWLKASVANPGINVALNSSAPNANRSVPPSCGSPASPPPSAFPSPEPAPFPHPATNNKILSKVANIIKILFFKEITLFSIFYVTFRNLDQMHLLSHHQQS